MLAPYQPPELPRHVAARVVSDALHYALELSFAPRCAADVQAYIVEFAERVDAILAPFEDHREIVETGAALKRGAVAYAMKEASHLFPESDGVRRWRWRRAARRAPTWPGSWPDLHGRTLKVLSRRRLPESGSATPPEARAGRQLHRAAQTM